MRARSIRAVAAAGVPAGRTCAAPPTPRYHPAHFQEKIKNARRLRARTNNFSFRRRGGGAVTPRPPPAWPVFIARRPHINLAITGNTRKTFRYLIYNIGVGGVSQYCRRNWLNYEKHLTNELRFVASFRYVLKSVLKGNASNDYTKLSFPSLIIILGRFINILSKHKKIICYLFVDIKLKDKRHSTISWTRLDIDPQQHYEISRSDLETNFDLVHGAEFYVIVMSLRKFDYRRRWM